MSPPPTLLTGFEPFGASSVNTSQLVVETIEARHLTGVVTAVLPTSYRRGEERLRELVEAHDPAAVVMLGLDVGTVHLRLEQVALNLDDAIALDNDGDVRLRRRIVDGAPIGYWSSLDLDALAETARRLGEQVVFSHDAGGYVCNHVFFVASHIAAVGTGRMGCAFVHLPPVTGPGDRVSRMVEVVAAWLTNHGAAAIPWAVT
jgi:pyroglutamyl-peptidase